MNLLIKEIALKNFKGCKNKTIKFEGNSKVFGANGIGKTTLADSFYWVFADCNTALIKNPPITPLNESECESRVEIELEIDGKPLAVAKTQKFKSKEADGKTTTSVTNGYEINSVPKSYKDFISDLSERGIDMDNFLTFSHPNSFTSDNSKQGREKQRELLFKMCEGITDEDIANSMDGIEELKSLMNNYKLNEIEQMQKATLKKIKDSIGVDDSIINARIDEALSQKITLDEKVLIEQKKQYEGEIERCEKELADMGTSKAEISKKICDRQLTRDKLFNDANKQISEEETKINTILHDLERTIQEQTFQKETSERDLTRLESLLEEAKADIENQRRIYKEEQDKVMDDKELICPVCNQPYTEDKAKEIRADFIANKTKRLDTLKSTGEELKSKISGYEAEIKSLNENIERLASTIEASKGLIMVGTEKRDNLPKDVSTPEIEALDNEIADLKEQLNTDDDKRLEEIESAKNVAQQMLNQIIGDLAKLERNADIDKRVAELREERSQAEINKANAEKILYQLEIFKKAKNNKLSDEINKHFKVAQFRLFKTLKNGTIEDACDVLIDGKEINTQVNQASQILARLDIIRGLSDYFETWLPVFIDDFALFTSQSEEQIKMDNQLIKLVARDGIQEIEVANG